MKIVVLVIYDNFGPQILQEQFDFITNWSLDV